MTNRPLSALGGVGFALLGILGAILYPSAPDFVDEPAKIVAFYQDNSSDLLVSNVLYLLAGSLLLVFVGYLLSAGRAVEGESGRATAIAFGAGIAGAALIIAAAGVDLVGALRVEDRDTIDPATATVFWDLSSVLYGAAAPMALGVSVLAVARLALKNGLLAGWVGWISIVLGIALLVPPINYIAVIVFTFWALLVSALLYAAPAETAGG